MRIYHTRGGGDDGPCPNLMSTDMTNGPLLFSILILTFEMCSVRLADADEQLFVCVSRAGGSFSWNADGFVELLEEEPSSGPV